MNAIALRDPTIRRSIEDHIERLLGMLDAIDGDSDLEDGGDAEPEPSAADFPLLASSIGVDGPDVASVAALVLATDAQWVTVGAAIEPIRLGAKKAIAEAVNEDAVTAAFNAVRWPAP